MEIKQFYDENLSHASYAIFSENQITVIDPARNPEQYYEYAKQKDGEIIAVIETHPHADFVSSHLEISKSTGAKIYVSKLVDPLYDYVPFDEGDVIELGKIKLISVNTPGHSPDSICILIKDEHGNDYAIATGDTLFVGDVGRPDLRESAGSMNAQKEELARMMFKTINEKLKVLSDDILVYPAHGAGSLCGKSSSKDNYSTIGKEKKENYAFHQPTEEAFVNELLKDQPFIPKYFSYDVDLNRRGASDYEKSIGKVKRIDSYDKIEKGSLIVDTRSKKQFSEGHLKNAINVIEDKKFETWLGSVIAPGEKFYLVATSEDDLKRIISRTAKIGYETSIIAGLVHENIQELEKSVPLDLESFRNNPDNYTIVDVRSKSEVKQRVFFKDSISIPLNEIRERSGEIPLDKPVVVHCAAGTRSAAASSILENLLSTKVYDLSDNIKSF